MKTNYSHLKSVWNRISSMQTDTQTSAQIDGGMSTLSYKYPYSITGSPKNLFAWGVGRIGKQSQKSKVESQKSKVESRKAKVESRKSKVKSRKSKVESQKSKVESQKSKVKRQKSVFRAGLLRRVAAVVLCLLTVGVGEMWADYSWYSGDLLYYDFSAVSGGVNWHDGSSLQYDASGGGNVKKVEFSSTVTMNDTWVIAKTGTGSWADIKFTNPTSANQRRFIISSDGKSGSWGYLDKYISGNDWSTVGDWSTTTAKMTNSNNGSYSITLSSVTAAQQKFKIVNYNTWTGAVGYSSNVTCTNGTVSGENGDGSNIQFTPAHAGSVTITYNVSDGKVYIRCPYQVSYAAGTNGTGTVSASAVTTYGSTCTLSSSTFSRTGYTQDGWSTSDGGTKAYALGGTYNGGYTDVTLYPHWSANSYSITYKDQGGGTFSGTQSSAPTTHTYGTATTLKTPTKTGYTFGGWFTNSGCTGTAVTSLGATGYTADITLYAKWTAKTYTITLDKNGGDSGGSATATYNSSSLTSVTHASRTDYRLNGYYTETSGGTKVINADGTLVAGVSGYTNSSSQWTKDGTATLYAQWTYDVTNYTVTFAVGTGSTSYGSLSAYNNTTSASISTGASVRSGHSVTFTASPNTGYTVEGWYTDASCTTGKHDAGNTTYTTSITGATTVYVKYVEKTWTVTFAAGTGGSVTTPASSSQTVGQLTGISIAATPSTGYTFGSWSSSSGGSFTSSTSTNSNTFKPTANTTVTASFTETMSSLTTSCHYDAGSPGYAAPTVSGSATTVGYGTTRTITATAAGTGYTFAGWTLTNCTRTDGGAANATSITIRSNGDGAAASAVANYEEVLTQDTWIIKGGSAFGGTAWSTEHALTKKTGHSTESIVYHTFSIAATNTGDTNADYKFKVVKKGNSDEWYGLTASGDQYYLLRSESGTEKTLSTSGANIELRADAIGDYVVKVDYSNASSPKVTVIFPASVTVSASAENIVYNGSTTLTAKADYLPSTSKTIEYEFFLGNSTADANRIDSKMTYNSVTDTVHSVTKTVTPNFTATDYAASQVYTVRITVDGVAYTRTITIYRKWDIYVRDNQGWGAMSMFQWNSSGNNASYPGTTCTQGVNDNNNWYTVTLNSRYVTTETSDYQSGFILSAGGSTALADATKTVDLHFYSGSPAACTYTEGSYWYIDSSTVDNKKYLTALTLPTTYINEDADACKLINTTEIFLTGNVSSTGGEGSYAHDMLEVGFVIGGTDYPMSMSCANETDIYFWGYVGGLTAGTTYTVKAYAKNMLGRAESNNSYDVTTRAADTITIKVRTGVSDPVPYIYAWTYDASCDHTTIENATWPGTAMAADITGTIYKWYTYELPNTYNQFKISENSNNGTDDFNNPFEETCYWYHSSEEEQSNRMGAMSCPYTEPQLMINDNNADRGEYNYYEMSGGGTITASRTLSADSAYNFKIVYNSEWYGKASTNVSRAANTLSGLSASDEANLYMVADVAGSYTFSYNTSTHALTITYPDAYTVTFGYGTGGTTVTASATSAGGTLASGDYVAAGDNVTFTQSPATGYTFKGWYTTADGNTTVTGMGVSDHVLDAIGANASVYAQYTPNNYTVTFDAATNGGSCATASKPVTYAETYGELPVATKADAYFKGWFTSSSGGTKVEEGTVVAITSAQTLYAQFEQDYNITVVYKCGDVTVKPATYTVASPTIHASDIEAPEMIGYSFSGWTGDNATFGDAASASTTVNVTAATTITANYSNHPAVYFKNNLGWDSVFVTFDAGWNESLDVPHNNGKSYYAMRQIGTSDIYYYYIPDTYVTNNYENWAWNIAFDNANYGNRAGGTGNWDAFYGGQFVFRSDFDPCATMFIPYMGDTDERNSGTYYATGCWIAYNATASGYKVNVNTYKVGSGGSEVKNVSLTTLSPGSTEFTATMELNGNYTYGFTLVKQYQKNGSDCYYTNDGTIDSHTTTMPWMFWGVTEISGSTSRCGITTSSQGDYVFSVSFATGRPMVSVEYPVSVGDYRVMYLQRGATIHDKPSGVIKTTGNYYARNDTVSFYINKATGVTSSMKIQKCTAVADGVATWADVAGRTIDLTDISGTGIYNFVVSQTTSGEPTGALIGGYTGNFYVRTDAAEGGWANYKSFSDNAMTYSEYSKDNGGYSHYNMKFVTYGTNIKFVIANDYSPCLSDTLEGDDYTSQTLEADANIRFTWNNETNAVSRAYLSGSSVASDLFLVLKGNSSNKLYSAASGTGVISTNGTENWALFEDDQNWIYHVDVYSDLNTRIKLTGNYNGKIEYFKGLRESPDNKFDTDSTESLISGEGSTRFHMRIIYDFKTNRLTTAWMPSVDDTISSSMAVAADLLVLRHADSKNEPSLFRLSGDETAVTGIEHIVFALELHPDSIFDGSGNYRDGLRSQLFQVCLPYDVNLNDIYGLPGYGTKWVIQQYAGWMRALFGWGAEINSFWATVGLSWGGKLLANEGFVISHKLTKEDFIDASGAYSSLYIYFPSADKVGGYSINQPDDYGTSEYAELACHVAGREVIDSNWRLMGLPGFYSAKVSSASPETAGWGERTGVGIHYNDVTNHTTTNWIYEWCGTKNGYIVKNPKAYALNPTSAYLMQYAGDITWTAADYSFDGVTEVSRVPRRHPEAYIDRDGNPLYSNEYLLTMHSIGGRLEDQTYIVIDPNATVGYTFNEDLGKAFASAQPQLYTLSENFSLAANTLPDSVTSVRLCTSMPEAGEYTIRLATTGHLKNAVLEDLLLQTSTNLSTSKAGYTFEAEAGETTDRFVIRFAPQQTGTATETYNLSSEGLKITVLDGSIVVENDSEIKGNVCLYDAAGRMIYSAEYKSGVMLPSPSVAGVYIVKVGNVCERVVISK